MGISVTEKPQVIKEPGKEAKACLFCSTPSLHLWKTRLTPSPPGLTPRQSLKSPSKPLKSPVTHSGCRPPASRPIRPKRALCPCKKYLLLAPRSNGVRLVKPWGLVRWDLVVGPRAPGAGGSRVLNSS